MGARFRNLFGRGCFIPFALLVGCTETLANNGSPSDASPPPDATDVTPVDDAPVTEPHSLVSLPTVAEPTRPARRLARGTAAEHADDDELDERTRGRAPLRRPSWLHLAA